MKKKRLIFFVVFVCLLAFAVILPASADTPTVTINGVSLGLQDRICLLYRVSVAGELPEEYDLTMQFSADAPSGEWDYVTVAPYRTQSETTYFFSYDGQKPMELIDSVYSRAALDLGEEVVYSDFVRYSVLDYAHDAKNSTMTATEGGLPLGEMVEKILEYGAASQQYFSYQTDRLATDDFYLVCVEGGTFPDGMKTAIAFEGDSVTLTADAPAEGYQFDHWENSAGQMLGRETTLTIDVFCDELYTAVETFDHEHVWDEGVLMSEATCTEDGVILFTCSVCGSTDPVLIPATGHAYNAEDVCERCGAFRYSQGLEFTSNGDGTCVLSGLGTCTDTRLVIPPVSPDGDLVVEIDIGAFERQAALTELIIPYGVEELGDGTCFECTSLTYVEIPNSVTRIGVYAFYGCTALEEVVFLGGPAEWETIEKKSWDTNSGDYELTYRADLVPSYYSKVIRSERSLAEALSDLVVSFRETELDPASYTVISEEYQPGRNGAYRVTISYSADEETYFAHLKLTVSLASVAEHVTYDRLEQVAAEKTGYLCGLPSIGDVEILVIPISFTNSDYGMAEEIKAKLEIAFNGTEEETGWRSLSGYYEEVSYGALNLHANILDPYETGEAYDLSYSGSEDLDYKYLENAIAYYDDTIDYSLFDQNDDGCIDCVYLVYLAPYDYDSDLWWAYCTEYYGWNADSYDEKALDFYLWMSIEFFDEPIYEEFNRETEKMEPTYIKINCETVIHETGHALGLDDYYHYASSGVPGGVGGFAMMDENKGDHDPYSKTILGWTMPTVDAGMDYEMTLRSFTDTGDLLILTKDNGGTYFEEYYIVAFYTPTGVNEYKAGHGLPQSPGVMLWHIDATLRSDQYYQLHDVAAYDITLYNNARTEHKLIDLIRAETLTGVRSDYYTVSDKDLFDGGGVIEGLTWYDGSDTGFTLTLDEFVSLGENTPAQVAVSVVFDE